MKNLNKTIILLSGAIISFIVFLLSINISSDQANTEFPEALGLQNPGVKKQYLLKTLRNPLTGKIPDNIRARELEFADKVQKSSLNKISSSREWINRGPYNVGGRTRALGIDIRNPKILIAGGVTGGIWKSIDGGESWYTTTHPKDMHSVSYLIQDIRPGKEDTWYYGTGESNGIGWLSGVGIFKSTDNGESWILLKSTSYRYGRNVSPYFSYINSMAIDRSNLEQDEIYAAAYGIIFRSTDGGSVWTNVLGDQNNSVVYSEVAVTSTGVVYATMSNGNKRGIWRSEDGVVWEKITPTNFANNHQRIILAVAPSNENIVYFLSEENTTFLGSVQGFWKYTHVSNDSSKENCIWENRSSNVKNLFKSFNSYSLVLAVYPEDENMVFVGGTLLYRSTNGFLNRSETVMVNGPQNLNQENHVDNHLLIFSYENPKIAFSANDGGLRRADDITKPSNMRWKSLDNGYNTTQFYTIAIPRETGDYKIVGGLQDNGSYYIHNNDSKASWKLALWGDGSFNEFVNSGKKLMTSFQFGETAISNISVDGTISYALTKVNPSLSDPQPFNPFIADMNNDNLIYMAGGKEILRCDNISLIPIDGSNTEKNKYWTKFVEVGSKISCLAVSRKPANILYVGTEIGEIFKIENANTNSPTVTNIGKNLGLQYQPFTRSIDVDPNDADKVLLCFGNYGIPSIYYSTDGGESWEDISGNLEEKSDGSGAGPSVRWIETLVQNESYTYFAGTSTGLYSTTALAGRNTIWIQEGSETIGNVIVEMIATRNIDGEVAVATHGNGVYSINNAPTEVPEKLIQPEKFILYQNYPNPFNPSTSISFSIPEDGHVLLTVYDGLGRTVKTLVNEYMPAGEHNVSFDASQLASGVYFYKLSKDDMIQTKKMLLVR
ncbi:MAG: T9SS type A sorting domain-containing protein [Bacteroidetes bacterium]|nr:T9SS type A sorting domain-containing protein [Bacteroidota bacterium]MBU1799634.1 T9SS type A sorting domain-containing protein [Bacteroidota bacterium]